MSLVVLSALDLDWQNSAPPAAWGQAALPTERRCDTKTALKPSEGEREGGFDGAVHVEVLVGAEAPADD